MKSLDQLRDELADTLMQRDALYEQRAPIDRKLELNGKRLSRLYELIGELVVAEARIKGPDWPTLVRQQDDEGMTYHRYVTEQFNNIGLWVEGYWSDTGDRCLKIMMTKGSRECFDITKKAVELIAPLLTEQDGMVRFGIFEHSLSAGGDNNEL
jgi:hypothetical protein